MAEGSGTADRLERLLYVLPAASRKQGASLEELADALGTTGKRIMQDLEQVTARAYYHPGGWPDDVSILIEPDRVRVMHAAGFERPIRRPGGSSSTACRRWRSPSLPPSSPPPCRATPPSRRWCCR